MCQSLPGTASQTVGSLQTRYTRLDPGPERLEHVLDGRDVLGCAQTGTGKTAAFALPILDHLIDTLTEKPVIRNLVLAPTRELAALFEIRPIEVLEDEAWEVPDSLSDDDWRAQSGWDGRRPVDGMNEEDEG